MENKQQLISVLIPYYNDKAFFKQAIESVLNQTYKNFELILLNHATTDTCREIAHSYKDPRIKHIDYPKNLGAGSGLLLIEFLKVAKGKYIKLFCADDVMLPNCLEDLVNYMQENPKKDFAFGDVEYVNEQLKKTNKTWFECRKGFSVDNDEIKCMQNYANIGSFLPYVGNIIKRETLDNIQINKSFIMLFDMSLWLSLLVNGAKIGYLNKVIALYRCHKNQVSSLHNAELSLQRTSHELLAFTNIFLNIKDINVIKKVFKDSCYIEKLNNSEDIPFIVMEYFLSKHNPTAYQHLFNLMENDIDRKHLEDKFGFGIKEFRELYSIIPPKNESALKNINMLKLIFLILRKLWKYITFQCFWNKKNGYSL